MDSETNNELELNSKLSECAKSGDCNEAEHLLRQHANPDWSSSDGSCLYLASKKGHLNIVKLFANWGANIDGRSLANGYSPLYAATKNNQHDVVKFLLGSGASVDLASKSGWTPLYVAILHADDDILETLLMAGADVNFEDNNGWTPLYVAAIIKENKQTVKLLLNLGATLFVPSLDGKSISEVAADEMREVLHLGWQNTIGDCSFEVAPGSSITSRPRINHFTAIKDKDERAVKIMLARGDIRLHGQKIIHFASENGLKGIIREQLMLGTNVDEQDSEGNSPLHLASAKGHEGVVRLLVENGASIYMKNRHNQIPLLLAEINQHDLVLKVLLMEFVAFLLKESQKIDQHPILMEPDIEQFIGYGNISNMFHIKPIFQGKPKKSLIEYILDNGPSMIKDRENLIDFLIELEKLHFPSLEETKEDRQFRVIQQLKFGLPSSEGLSSCIASVHDRFPWSSQKMWLMRTLSFINNIIVGYSLYFADFYTDFVFIGNFANANNTSKLKSSCLKTEQEYYSEALEHCSSEFHTKWMHRHDCADWDSSEDSSFIEKTEYKWLACAILLLHCFLPLLFAIILSLSWRDLSRFPFPIWTKTTQLILEWQLYFNYTQNNSAKKEISCTQLKNHQQNIALSMLGEAAFEDGFHFWFQTIFYLPILIGQLVTLNNVVNWRTASITLSFISFAWASCAIRNQNKHNALKWENHFALIARIVLDATSKVALFSCFMYLSSNGHFSIWKTIGAYYSMVVIILILNICYTDDEINELSMEFFIGALTNSYSSALSYNNLNFGLIFKSRKSLKYHQTTFLKQLFYFIICLGFNVGFTIASVFNITNDMKLHDTDGRVVRITRSHVYWILGIGWTTFVLSWIMNIIYYLLHPSDIDLDKGRLNRRCQFYFFGRGYGIGVRNGEYYEDDSLKSRQYCIEPLDQIYPTITMGEYGPVEINNNDVS